MKTGAGKAITILCVCVGLLFTVAVPALAANNSSLPGTAASGFDETTVTTTISGSGTTLTSVETSVIVTTAVQVTTVFVEQPSAPAGISPIWLIAIVVIFVVLIALVILLLFSKKRKTGSA